MTAAKTRCQKLFSPPSKTCPLPIRIFFFLVSFDLCPSTLAISFSDVLSPSPRHPRPLRDQVHTRAKHPAGSSLHPDHYISSSDMQLPLLRSSSFPALHPVLPVILVARVSRMSSQSSDRSSWVAGHRTAIHTVIYTYSNDVSTRPRGIREELQVG